MDRYTLKAAAMTLALYSIAVPVILTVWAGSGASNVNGSVLGAAIYFASAYIFWSWLVIDAPRNTLPRSTVFVALAAYILLFVLAVVGYLFYSRGPIRGFGAVMWFVLLVGGAIVGFLVVGKVISVLSPFIPLKP